MVWMLRLAVVEFGSFGLGSVECGLDVEVRPSVVASGIVSWCEVKFVEVW